LDFEPSLRGLLRWLCDFHHEYCDSDIEWLVIFDGSFRPLQKPNNLRSSEHAYASLLRAPGQAHFQFVKDCIHDKNSRNSNEFQQNW
jgi:hypothetical protein